MDNLSEHKFDDLFREGSEKVEFEYREDAWAALDERLEEKERKRRLLWIFTGIALSTLVIGSMFYFLNKTQDVQSEENPIEENVAITQEQKVVSNETTITNVASPTLTENTKTSQIIRNKNTIVNSSRVETEKFTAQQTTEINAVSKNIKASKQNNSPILIENQEAIISVKEKEEKIIEKEIKNLESTIDNFKGLITTDAIPPILGISMQELENGTKENVDKFATKTELSKSSKNQFSFGAFGSLDFNSLSLGNDKIEQGYRIGLRTDYNFAKCFSVGIGAAFSKKTYTAQGFRYNAKPGFWTDGIAPIEVEATSNLIEIPLELRFYAKGHNQDGFFAGAGINSYHMVLEQYNFHYEEFCEDAINDWEERGTNTNLFAVAALTVGYQKTINKNMAIQIAPYVNLPFTGIGQGNVNLQSAGLNIAVNWRK